MYATYEFYKETFCGSLTETDYKRFELRAEAYIRYLTYVNGDIFAKEDDAVKMAVCAAADVIAANVSVDEDGVVKTTRTLKSETTDGYSVTYADGDDGADEEEALRKKILEAIEIYLLPTGWLSRVMGCRHDCECRPDNL